MARFTTNYYPTQEEIDRIQDADKKEQAVSAALKAIALKKGRDLTADERKDIGDQLMIAAGLDPDDYPSI